MNGDRLTASDTTATCHHGRPRAAPTNAPAARPTMMAMTVGSTMATRKVPALVSDDSVPSITGNPGRPVLGAAVEGSGRSMFDNPTAWAMVVRHRYSDWSHPTGTV